MQSGPYYKEAETARVYSQRLGALTPQQFQAALMRFDLGTFVSATPVAQGLFGQNVFVQSTQGDYVLRGAPHYPWQFPKERFGARLLHERTRVAVANPYILDTSTDIFGWPYLLMPRLHGSSPANRHWTYEAMQPWRDCARFRATGRKCWKV